MGAIQNADGTTASCDHGGCAWSHWIPASWAGLAVVNDRIAAQKHDAAQAHAELSRHVDRVHVERWPRPNISRTTMDQGDFEWESYCSACGQGYDGDDHVCDLADVGPHYGRKTPVEEPIEIRLKRGLTSLPWVLVAHVQNGRVWMSLTAGGHGVGHAISSLQLTKPVPAKAVPGWQAELLDAARSGLHEVIEVR